MFTSSKSARAGAYADDALGATGNALESTKQFASQALDKAGERVRDLRYGATDLARKSASSMSDATAAAQRQLGEYADATRRYVADEPIKSALIAAAIGAAVAALLMALSRSRRDYY
ncbi:MAG TPA: hypothetical protein VN649_10015 [Ramlibacter sp.]|nr:hypothetical protein [Ramlibacter sp.]